MVTLDQTPVTELARTLDGDRVGLAVLDVRGEDEWRVGHIPGAVHLFAGDLARGAAPPVGGSAPVAVICGTGYRSNVAASLLQQRDYRNLINVTGGMAAWTEAKLPTTTAGTRSH